MADTFDEKKLVASADQLRARQRELFKADRRVQALERENKQLDACSPAAEQDMTRLERRAKPMFRDVNQLLDRIHVDMNNLKQ